jgi:hypothetical protein
MLELKKFPTKNAAAANTSYDQEFSGRTFDSINFRFDGTTTASATGTDPTFSAARLLGTPELNQAGEPLVRMAGVDWLYLSAYTNGAFPSYTQNDQAASTQNQVATARIKFSRLVPGSYVNANLVKAFFRGSTAALTAAGDKVTAYDLNVRPLAEALEYNPPAGGFLRPRISQRSVGIPSADSNQQTVLNIEQDLIFSGIMMSAYGGGELTEVDGLIKNVRVELTTPGRGTLEIINSDWGNLRDYSCERSGLNSTDVANTAGTVVLPMTDRRATNLGGALFVPAGSAITITIDSSGTAQSPYTSVTPAAGDLVRVTQLAFTPVAGAGDGAVQSPAGGAGRAGVPGRAATQATLAPRNARRSRRATRRGRRG